MNSSWIKRHKLLSSLIFMILLVIGIIGSNSTITSWLLMSWLKDHAQDVELQQLKLSLWNSQLDIDGLVATNGMGQRLAVDSLSINWVLSDLWDGQLTIKNINLDGLHLDISADNYSPVTIGPIYISRLVTEDVPSSDQEMVTEPWTIDIGAVHLSDTKVCYRDSVVIFLDESNICMEWQDLKLETKFNLLPNQSYQLSGAIDLQDFTVTDSNKNEWLNITQLNLNHLSSSPKKTNLKQIKLSKVKLLAQHKDDLFANNGMAVSKLTVDDFDWVDSTKTVSATAIVTEGLLLNQRASNHKIMHALVVNSLNVASITSNQQITSIDSIKIKELSALESVVTSKNNDASENNYLTRIGTVFLDKIDIETSQLQINLIAISDFEGSIIANPNGLNITQWMPNIETLEEAEKETVKAIEKMESNPYQVSISEINMAEDSKLSFSDATTEKTVFHELSDIQFNVTNLQLGNNTKVQSPLKYSAKIGEAGSISGEGYFSPQENSIDLDIKGNVQSVDLVNLTDYSAKFIGYRIDRGLLNVNYNVKIVDNQIDAKIETLFEKFELATLQAHEQSATNEQLGIPLPMALNLLRDSNDNIEIDMPVTGDVNAPDFSISNILTKVTFTAIKNAVIYNYSPLGMLSLASGVFDLATALRFDPILFEQRSTLLSDKSKQQLDKIKNLMLDKPKVKFVICAQATHLDKLVVEVEQTVTSESNSEITPFDPTPLFDLANQRQSVVTDYLMKENNIEASRLIGCNVKLSKNPKAVATVDISI